MDLRSLAKEVQVPVIAINSDYTPSNPENNKKYFNIFKEKLIAGTGHYPMLENSPLFNILLAECITELTNEK